MHSHAGCDLHKLLQREVSKFVRRRSEPDTVTVRINIDKHLAFAKRKNSIINQAKLWLHQNLERPNLTSLRLHVLQRTVARVRTSLQESTRTITSPPDKQLVQARSRLSGAKILDDVQPLIEMENHTVESATISALDTLPVCNVAPRNKLQLALHFRKLKNRRLL